MQTNKPNQAEQRQRGEEVWEEALARTKAAGEQAMHQRFDQNQCFFFSSSFLHKLVFSSLHNFAIMDLHMTIIMDLQRLAIMEEEEGQVAVMVEETYERLDKVSNISLYMYMYICICICIRICICI